MLKFKKKPDTRIFEVEQYKAELAGECNPAGVCHGYLYDDCPVLKDTMNNSIQQPHAPAHLHTIHAGQTVLLEDGDYVMPEPDGKHFYTIKPDIFEATYEPVEKDAL